MRALMFLTLIALIALVGCSENTDVVHPETQLTYDNAPMSPNAVSTSLATTYHIEPFKPSDTPILNLQDGAQGQNDLIVEFGLNVSATWLVQNSHLPITWEEARALIVECTSQFDTVNIGRINHCGNMVIAELNTTAWLIRTAIDPITREELEPLFDECIAMLDPPTRLGVFDCADNIWLQINADKPRGIGGFYTPSQPEIMEDVYWGVLQGLPGWRIPEHTKDEITYAFIFFNGFLQLSEIEKPSRLRMQNGEFGEFAVEFKSHKEGLVAWYRLIAKYRNILDNQPAEQPNEQMEEVKVD